ncbi:IclR family transcriptional regulator [Pseudomonas sp. PA1(2017)]|uniref:IclR family transcriptional regulator domain-containing protein n=1 Tax=Pseudomonas sp. PA1(2017) TaxID=1932113 RepID=UPI0009662F10|nr:IclR family transcriptional regulator C-terminal domain-containing protein [Pseudomonas sp. PA1(2017)]OLU16703.1 IclR family transcriptional regulator [Pseudomonas sp. PA1(2017)]
MKTNEGTASLEKALDVLEAIGSAPLGLNQGELSNLVPLPRTTLYRILGSLVDRGMIRRDPLRKVYRLGFRYLELVRNAYLKPDLVAAATSELRALRDFTGETSYLAVLDGNQVLSLERCDGAHTTRSAATLGQSKPVYCTGQGKAILSALNQEEREKILKGLTLTELTPRTLTDRRQLQIELQVTSARGYAIDDEEIVLGVRCVAAPIVDDSGVVHGAISVAGPAYRLPRSRLELLGPELADAARRIGAQLRSSAVNTDESSVQVIEDSWAFSGAFPRWDQKQRCLYWADTLAPAVHRLDDQGSGLLARLDAPITGLELLDDGLLVSHRNGWSLIDREGNERPLADWPGKSLLGISRHPDGSLWGCLSAGSGCRVGELSAGELRDPRQFQEPISALCWDGTGEHLYAAAPQSGTIYLLQKDSQVVRRLATLPKGAGELGGLAVDAVGGIWASLIGGWSLVRFAGDGSLDQMVGVPVPSPTDICFEGDGSNAMFITSARHHLSKEVLSNSPSSGSLLKLRYTPPSTP